MRRSPPDTLVPRLVRFPLGRSSAALVLAALMLGSTPSSGGTEPHAWREERARLALALRDPSLRGDERRALRVALQDAIDRDRAAGGSETAGISGTQSEPSVDGAWARIPAPTPRAFHTAIYDPARGRMVVFGGFDWWQQARYEDAWALSLDGTPTWTPLAAASFGHRWGHAAIYDPVRDRMVVVGGSSSQGKHNDVWSLSLGGTPAWTPISPAGTAPTPRGGLTAIYDAQRDRIIVFGGFDSNWYRNDVWALSLNDNPTWTEIQAQGTAPSPREWHTAIYDPVGDRMLVLGGYGDESETSDVWELSLGGIPSWSKLTPTGAPPDPRARHTAIYDPVRHRMVVFGGYSGNLAALSLDGTPAWTTLASTDLEGLDWAAAIYDPARDAMVGFGGETYSYSIPSDDVWSFSMAAPGPWATLQTVGRPPDGLRIPPAVHDPVRDRLLVGGRRADTQVTAWWTLSLDQAPAWRELATEGTSPGGDNAIYDALRDRVLVLGKSGTSLAVWSLSLGQTPAWTTMVVAGTPPGSRDGYSMIYDALRDRIVIFGGSTFPAGPNNEVWMLTLGDSPAWSNVVPTGAPPGPRDYHTAVYDPVRDRMIVFGGDAGGNPAADLWALSLGDPPTWSSIVAQGLVPSPLARHSAIYDPVRDRMVVFGGDGAGNESWSLSLGGSPGWSQLAAGGLLPQPRCMQSAVYDPQRDQMIVLGGSSYCDTPEPSREVWTLTWGTPLLPPANVAAQTGPGAITLVWTPSPSANVSGYRIGYGPQHAAVRYSGDQAAEGPSGLEVPAGQTSITLTCMPDSIFNVAIQAVGASGGRSEWSQAAMVQPLRIGGGLAVHPPTLNPASNGRWVSAVMEPGDGYEAGQVVLESLLLNGALAPVQATLGDENGNGVPDLALKFERADVMALFPSGGDAELEATGHLLGCQDLLTCSVRDTVRLIQPSVSHPLAGTEVTAGSVVEIAWTLPSELVVDSLAVMVSVDNQQTWEIVGRGPEGWLTCEWIAPPVMAESCYVAVVVYFGGDVMGVGYGGPFGISTTVAVAAGTDRLELEGPRPQPFRAKGSIAFGVGVASPVTLQLFDLRGRLVETLVNGPLPAGRHEIAWDAHGVGAGVYFLQLRSGALRESRRLVLIR